MFHSTFASVHGDFFFPSIKREREVGGEGKLTPHLIFKLHHLVQHITHNLFKCRAWKVRILITSILR